MRQRMKPSRIQSIREADLATGTIQTLPYDGLVERKEYAQTNGRAHMLEVAESRDHEGFAYRRTGPYLRRLEQVR
jgi:chromosome segregation and condensation protein ScpB